MLTISYTYVTQKDEKNESVISIDIIEMNNEGRLNFYIQLSTIESIFFLFAFIIINIMTIFAYKKMVKKNIGVNLTANGNKSKDKIERKLCFFALFTSFGQMFIAIVVICIYCGRVLDIASILSFLGGIYTIVMDVGILVLPTWPLLWASRSFRIKLIQSILPEKLHEKIIGPITQSSKMVQNGQTTIKVLPANTIKMT
ncbi:hypothetical protein ACQ4LE_005339 [Meloidogyne hapla]